MGQDREEEFEGRFKRYSGVVGLAERRFRQGDAQAAVGLAQIAARYAFPSNVGLFASPRLERLLTDVGQGIPVRPVAGRRDGARQAKRIIHVLSYARPIGGDTRFVWRWIQEDRGNTHFVAVTTQSDVAGQYSVPPALKEAVERSGGSFHLLQASTSRPLDQAQELRAMCQQMDIVVLHLFPYDVLPILALAAGCDGPRIIYVHHSDHTFWIGASVADLIVHLRSQSPDFLRNRRQLAPGRDAFLPIPLAYVPPDVTESEAKAGLGYDQNTVVLLTIASAHKYASPGRQGLLDLVVPVLREISDAVLIAVGPEPQGDWREAHARTGGRVIALGPRFDNAMLYAAADVYLDSVPLSSITSLLEAGSCGTPLLGFTPPSPDLSVLGPGAPGLEGAMEMASDTDSYRERLRRLILDKDYRARSGSRIKEQIISKHSGDGWRAALEVIYTQVRRDSVRRGCLDKQTDAFTCSMLDREVAQLYGHADKRSGDMRRLLWAFLKPLPYGPRVAIIWELYRIGFGLSVFNLLPTSCNLMARNVAGSVGRLRRQIANLKRSGRVGRAIR